MANGLTTDWSKLSKELEELTKKKNELKPRISFGQGPTFTTTGTQTASQDIAQGYKRIDPRELTPFQKEMMGGEAEIAKEKEKAKNLIASETSSAKPLSITGEKKAEVKAAPKSATKAKDEEPPPPDIYRVMLQGGKSSEDEFYDTKEAADAALKKMGGKGAVAGIRFPAKSREEKSTLKEQYMQQARIGEKTAMLPKSDETEKDRIMRQVVEVNPRATKAQQESYYNTLTASRAKGAEREAASKERAAKFRSDIAAKEASNEQLSQYNQQLSTLKRAYRDARRTGDYVEQYRLGDFINSYQAGIPKEMGARQKAARTGIIAERNRELSEKMRREREARVAAERTSMANPDFQQFAQGNNPQYR
jgi:hypothetical protein